MLRYMCEDFPSLKEDIQLAATTEYRLTIDDLPSPEREKECAVFESKLCRDPYTFKLETAFIRSHIQGDEWVKEGSPLQGEDVAMRQCEGVVATSLESSLVRRPTHSQWMSLQTESRGRLGRRPSRKLSLTMNWIRAARGTRPG